MNATTVAGWGLAIAVLVLASFAARAEGRM